MTTWTIKRIVILVAAVAVGVLALKEAFPVNVSQAITARRPATTPTPSPGGSPAVSPSPSRKAKVRGVVVQVLNGSGTTGLAASTSQMLKNKGYNVKLPANAKTTPTTTVYYRSDSLPEATLLRDRYFPDSPLKPFPASFSRSLQIVVVLGTDSTGTHSP
jgi:LytR cell envelope-related transcriptional attenuator